MHGILCVCGEHTYVYPESFESMLRIVFHRYVFYCKQIQTINYSLQGQYKPLVKGYGKELKVHNSGTYKDTATWATP